MNFIKWIDQRRHWWKVFVIIVAVSVTVVAYIGYQTYRYAPPIVDFVSETGETVFPAHAISDGQQVFARHGLMEFGSFLGDGALRGPDFCAEALHSSAVWLTEVRDREWKERLPDEGNRAALVRERVRQELHRNRYDPVAEHVVLSPAQVGAFRHLRRSLAEEFGAQGELAGGAALGPANSITDSKELDQLAAFFYWGGWMCAAERPGTGASYTHDWPYDPLAGNTPTAGVMFWSLIGVLALVLSMGVVFYFYGKMDREAVLEAQRAKAPPLATAAAVAASRPTPTQRACYKFFAVAAFLFAVQVGAGLLTVADFVGFFSALGFHFSGVLPETVTRAWHTQIAVLWIAICWFAATLWVLPLICRPEPRGQLAWVNGLFWSLLVVGLGTLIGIPLGVSGLLGDSWRWFGLQGWEFMELGRFFQYLLFFAFALWLVITVRGLWPFLRRKQSWSLPNWMVYSIAGILFMFSASFVADPDTNFVIADFWRWCTIHMWVEAFFELFTTIIVAYFLYLMGFVSHLVASRVVYLAAVLFLGSGLVGISHNFYWNAKSIETIALGGVLSSLQVVPLVLLTVEAWRFRSLPGGAMAALRRRGIGGAEFGLAEPFLFLVGVNFWNFMGAGVLGFLINLPIVNYYQHGTYLTVNHAHAALFGVYGNLAIASMLFCARWLIEPERWNPRLLRRSFWCLNLGLGAMVLLDLFPVGLHQLFVVLRDGYAAARSPEYIEGTAFQLFTWLRGLGSALFVCGGVLPLSWFMISRWRNRKSALSACDPFVAPPTILAMAPPAEEE